MFCFSFRLTSFLPFFGILSPLILNLVSIIFFYSVKFCSSRYVSFQLNLGKLFLFFLFCWTNLCLLSCENKFKVRLLLHYIGLSPFLPFVIFIYLLNDHSWWIYIYLFISPHFKCHETSHFLYNVLYSLLYICLQSANSFLLASFSNLQNWDFQFSLKRNSPKREAFKKCSLTLQFTYSLAISLKREAKRSSHINSFRMLLNKREPEKLSLTQFSITHFTF